MSETDGSAPPPDTRLILIRHGESNVSVERRIGGFRTCTGLSDLGRRQAERLRDRLQAAADLDADLDADVLVTSNFARAAETAEIIAPALADLDPVVDPGFGEHDPGPELDGTTFQEYTERFGMPDWDGDPHYEVFEGGETIAEFQLRVGSSISRLLRDHAGSTVVIACHAGVIDTAFRRFVNAPPTGSFVLHTLNTSITEFSRPATGNARLVRYNDASHLSGLPSETPRTGS